MNLLTTKEACAFLKVHRNTLALLREVGKVKALNVSTGTRPTWRYYPESLQEIQEAEVRRLKRDLQRRLR